MTVFSKFNSNSKARCIKIRFFPGWRGTPGAMMRVQMRMTTNVAPCLSDQRSLLLNAELSVHWQSPWISTMAFKFLRVLRSYENYVSSAGSTFLLCFPDEYDKFREDN